MTKPSKATTEPASVASILSAKKQKTKTQKDVINCPKCNRAFKKLPSLTKHQETCDGKLGGGMPRGHQTQKTVELRVARQQMQERIAGRVNELLAAQFRMALGTHRLFMRELVDVGRLKRGKADDGNQKKSWKVTRVFSDADFMLYLSLPHDEHGSAKDPNTGIEYFYQVSGEGNHQALMNLLDRAFGKPKENVEIGEDPDAPLPVHGTGTTTALRAALLDMVKQQIATPPEDNSATKS